MYQLSPESADESIRGRLYGAVASVLESLCRVETSCPNCGGTGEIEETRPKRLDELSGLQKSFLLEADMERETPDEETQREMEQMRQQGGAGMGGQHGTPASTNPGHTSTPNVPMVPPSH